MVRAEPGFAVLTLGQTVRRGAASACLVLPLEVDHGLDPLAIIDATHLELSEAISLAPGELIKVSIHDLGKARQEFRTDAQLSGRDRERAWCMANQEVLRTYAGQWIVLEGEEIVAHGTNPRQLVEAARSRGVHTPFIFHVENPHADIAYLGL